MKTNYLQAEIAKELLNNNDATIQGILLAVIVILLVAIGILWKENINDKKYIRSQDKANIELMMSITNTMDDVAKSTDKTGFQINDIKEKVSNILNLINERLKR